jgi:hypothetical protein
MSMKNKIDPETGLFERNVDIESILKSAKIPEWGRPTGKELFKRIADPVDYI